MALFLKYTLVAGQFHNWKLPSTPECLFASILAVTGKKG